MIAVDLRYSTNRIADFAFEHIPGILPAAAIFIMTIGLLSAAGPARRAVRIDPTEALRDG